MKNLHRSTIDYVFGACSDQLDKDDDSEVYIEKLEMRQHYIEKLEMPRHYNTIINCFHFKKIKAQNYFCKLYDHFLQSILCLTDFLITAIL